MFKQKMLFPLAMVFMLALFLLPISGGQIYAADERSEENLETSDVLQKQQDSPVDYKFRGHSLLNKGQIDDAISDLNKAVELNPKDAGAYFYRGNAYYKKGQIDKALSDYSEAIKINPRYTNAYFSRGLHYVGVEEYSKAISDFNKVISITPDNASAYYYRGASYFGKKKYKKALSDYDKAIELDPEYVNAYINRGLYYHGINQYPKAISDYSKALELNPSSPAAKQLLGKAITDRDLYEQRMRDNIRVGDMGVVTRQTRTPPVAQPKQ